MFVYLVILSLACEALRAGEDELFKHFLHYTMNVAQGLLCLANLALPFALLRDLLGVALVTVDLSALGAL